MDPLFTIIGIGLLAALSLAAAAARTRPPGRRVRSFFWALWVVLGAARLGCFWYLLYWSWVGPESLSMLLLIFPLLPEALLVPQGHTWTPASAALFSLALVAGALLMAAIAAGIVALVARLFSARSTRAMSE